MSALRMDAPVEVIVALAEACGFRVVYDRTPGVDSWTLSSGHGLTHTQHSGTQRDILAFLYGYAAMQLKTTQMLNELDNAHRRLILEMRRRLDRE